MEEPVYGFKMKNKMLNYQDLAEVAQSHSVGVQAHLSQSLLHLRWRLENPLFVHLHTAVGLLNKSCFLGVAGLIGGFCSHLQIPLGDLKLCGLLLWRPIV